jgi:hypothetical protein
MASPSRPAGLGPRGRRLWRALIGDVTEQLDDDGAGNAGHLELLIEACRTLDLVDRMDEQLAGSLTVPGSQGQIRPHPLLRARTDAIADLSDLLVRLR